MSEFTISEDAQSGESSGDLPSSSSQQPNESAFPDEDEETITMLDIIEREDKLEEEASAVLGNSDEKNCTYPKGYIPRQALYSCTTCSDDPNNMAAICLACSLECHDNHEVIELYTKRNYRCDCGNSKFKKDFVCKLADKQTEKAPVNELNKYNHNFSGRYCICDKRYPPDENDDSAESHDEMWQCIACEDWYHSKHLGVEETPSKFEEMLCGECVQKFDFVHYYARSIIEANNNVETSEETPSVEANTADRTKIGVDSDLASSATGISNPPKTLQLTNVTDATQNYLPSNTITSESDTNDSQLENKDPTHCHVTDDKLMAKQSVLNDCLLERLKKEQQTFADNFNETGGSATQANSSKKHPIFWPDCSWRSKLCRCSNCISMYKAKQCEYLLDENDTVQYYEAQGKAIAKGRATPYEMGMSALNQMNRAAVVEALHGYDELKADLSSYLRKFADSNKVVREEDIHDFFAQLKSKKRPRLEYE